MEIAKVARAAAPMTPEQLGRDHYAGRLALDDEFRNDPRYAGMPFDDGLVEGLRRAIAGRASDAELAEMLGREFARYRARGNIDVDPATFEGRRIMRTLAVAEYEALERAAERDEGDFSGEPSAPFLSVVEPEPTITETTPAVSLVALLDSYLKELERSGRGAEARRRWTPVFADLVRFLKHDDANLLTKRRVIEWKDNLLERYAPKTVRDSHIGALKAVLTWAVDNDRLTLNAAQGVKVRLAAKQQAREKGFTDSEANAILSAVASYKPKHSDNPQTREFETLTAAKRWAPWLCAHTGARIAEITQLRKEDVREADGTPFLRLTPGAGSVKSGLYRDVPLHPQLVELGFLDFVKGRGPGPLFYKQRKETSTQHPSKRVAQALAKWLRTIDGMPADVDPSHGWRHRMKTIGRELGVDPRIVDAIQGHASRTAGENYGDVTLKARNAAMTRFPAYRVEAHSHGRVSKDVLNRSINVANDANGGDYNDTFRVILDRALEKAVSVKTTDGANTFCAKVDEGLKQFGQRPWEPEDFEMGSEPETLPRLAPNENENA